MFFKEVDRKILTREDEIVLFKKREKALLEENAALIHEIDSTLLKHNIGLIYSFVTRVTADEYLRQDLFQEGAIALLNSIKSYDYTNNAKFSTFAMEAIKMRLHKRIPEIVDSIRKPVYVQHQIDILNRFVLKYIKKNGVAPSTEEIAEGTDLSIKDIKKIQNIPGEPLSYDMDVEVHPGVKDNFVSFVDDSSPLLEDVICDKYYVDYLYVFFDEIGLTEREKEVVYKRLGFIDDYCMSFVEIGNELGISSQRAGALYRSALNKLSSNSSKQKIIDELSCGRHI